MPTMLKPLPLLLIFFSTILIEVFFVSIFTQSIPNQLKFTFIENIDFYIDLLSSNPSMAFKLILIDNPVFIVQRLDELKSSQIWGVYFMPINIITLLVLSLYISRAKKLEMNSYQWSGIWFASIILIFSMLYLRIQTCCTSGPTWLLEIWIFSQVNDPLGNVAMWQNLYIKLIDIFTLIQFFIASIGATIIYMIFHTELFNKKSS